MQKTKEIRFAEVQPSGVNAMTLVGNPIVYDSPTTINLPEGGSYTEVIARGALDDCDLSDSTLIYNHDQSRVPLARAGRTMRLERTEKGLHMVAELSGDSSHAREVYSAVKRGDLSGLSFAFVVPEGGSDFDAMSNTRTIRRIAKVYEISVCPFPAYQEASVEARNAVEAERDALRVRTAGRAQRIQAMAKAVAITQR